MGRLKALPSRLDKLPTKLQALDPLPKTRTQRRDADAPWRAWYKTARWQKLRLVILKRDLWTCAKTGQIVSGKYPAPDSPVIDHIRPHRGDAKLFWDPENLQVLCKSYHDSEKQKQEQRDYFG